MSISDAEFRAWLDAETSIKCVLVEADYRDPTATEFVRGDGMFAGLRTEYMATLPFVTQPGDTPENKPYLSLIKSIPGFTQSMSDAMIGKTTANLGEIVISGGDSYTDSWLFDREWIGWSLRVFVGDQSWARADFRPVWHGVCADLKLRGTNEIVLVARDMQHILNQPIRTPPISAGPSAGIFSPLVFGPAFNIPCVLIDATTHKYIVNDGEVSAITAVRVGGVATGGYTANLFEGTFTLSSAPRYSVTADVTGPFYGASHLDNASDIIKYIVTTRGYFTDADLDADSFNALKVACQQKLAYMVPMQETMVYEAVDEICYTVGAFTAMSRDGKFYVRRFDFDGESKRTITASDIVEHGLALDRILPPVKEIRLGAKRNNARNAQTNNETTFGMGELLLNKNHLSHQETAVVENPNADTIRKGRRIPNREPIPVDDGYDEGVIPTLFVNAADASAEGERRMGLWGVNRYIFSVTCFVSPLELNLGDAVTLVHPRYGLSAGRKGVIIKLSERISQKRVDLSVIL